MGLRYGILQATLTTAQSIAFEHLFLISCLNPYPFSGQLNPLATVAGLTNNIGQFLRQTTVAPGFFGINRLGNPGNRFSF
jgi:hypothetical protein